VKRSVYATGVRTEGSCPSMRCLVTLLSTDYYDILQNIVEYTFGGAKELMVVCFQCDWFDPINDTRVDDFGMVEVKYESCYSGSNLLLAHQTQ
jgi:hypothetical protein